jgi:hypothetical protein
MYNIFQCDRRSLRFVSFSFPAQWIRWGRESESLSMDGSKYWAL